VQLSDIDNVLWMASALGELVLLSILIWRRTYQSFPVFFSWVAVIVLLEPTFYWLLNHLSPATYAKAFFALTFPQFLLEAAVLVEVAASVFRPAFKPAKQGLPNWFPIFVVVVMVVIGGIAFLVAAHLNAATLIHRRTFLVISATMAILRLVTFICIAACSQILGLGWKNHALQLASGLAFYAAVTLIVEIAHSHLRAGPDYSRQFFELDHLRVVGYLCSLYYWCYSFARQEAPRKEFNSKMSELLVSIAGTTKRQQTIVARKRK
jgi:hypothetical protein